MKPETYNLKHKKTHASCFMLHASWKKGFTLLEILVAVGIIATLISIGTSSYSTAQRKSRDAKRKADVKAIQNALEQYYSICGYNYPIPAGGIFTNIYCASPTTGIMPTVPVDPRTTTPYPCSSCTSTSYTLCANSMESETPTGYCVSNQQ